MHSGALARFPRLRVLLVHGGGFLPYQIGRFDHAHRVRPELAGTALNPPGAYLDRFWFDTLTHADASLAFLGHAVGLDHLVFGTDRPFDMADPDGVARLRRAGLDPHRLGETALDLLRAT